MRLCTCRYCGHVHYKQRANPFCSSACRKAYADLTKFKPTANLTGAINDTNNTSNKD